MVLTRASVNPLARVHVMTSAHTLEYQRFLPEWLDSVLALNTTPDTITIGVTDYRLPTLDILNELERRMESRRTPLRVHWLHDVPEHLPACINQVIDGFAQLAPADWVAKLDADDRACTDWLDGIRETDADVWSVRMIPVFEGRRLSRGSNALGEDACQHILDSARQGRNLVWSCSPFRRWLWDRNRFANRPGEDWQFWVDAAAAGARFGNAPGAYEYHQHPGQLHRRTTDAQMRATLVIP